MSWRRVTINVVEWESGEPDDDVETGVPRLAVEAGDIRIVPRENHAKRVREFPALVWGLPASMRGTSRFFLVVATGFAAHPAVRCPAAAPAVAGLKRDKARVSLNPKT